MPNFNQDSIFEAFGDIFGDLFGGGGGRRRGPQPGRDLGTALEIDLLEAYRGCSRSVTFKRHETCNDCSGSGARRGTKPSACKQCGGKGVTLVRQGFLSIRQTCPGCGGFGYAHVPYRIARYLRHQEAIDTRIATLGILFGALIGFLGSAVSVGRHLRRV